MIVTISSMPGAGSTTVSTLLANRLGYRLVTVGEVYKQLALERGVPPGELDKFWRTAEGKSESLHNELDAKTREIARNEKNVILNAKLAAFQVPDADFKVFLTAPLDVRARRSAERDGKPFEKIKKAISEREKSERKEWKEMYGVDYVTDTQYYDLVINTQYWPAEEITNFIEEMITKKQNLKWTR